MKKLFLILILAISTFFLVFPMLTTSAGVVKSKKVVALPSRAVEVAPDVYFLGTSKDKSGKVVEGYAYVHRSRPENNVKPPRTSEACYGFLSKGAKWKLVEPWVFNTSNTDSLSSSFLFSNLGSDISKWEAAAAYNIIGSGSTTNVVLEADMYSTDNVNEIYFGDIEESNAIAITIVWGVFGGSVTERELVEWDQVYDDVTYNWSALGEAGKMDFENIATHELGHTIGLDDLYQSACNQQTMYGYASYGETIKRDLANGDILGIQKLY